MYFLIAGKRKQRSQQEKRGPDYRGAQDTLKGRGRICFYYREDIGVEAQPAVSWDADYFELEAFGEWQRLGEASLWYSHTLKETRGAKEDSSPFALLPPGSLAKLQLMAGRKAEEEVSHLLTLEGLTLEGAAVHLPSPFIPLRWTVYKLLSALLAPSFPVKTAYYPSDCLHLPSSVSICALPGYWVTLSCDPPCTWMNLRAFLPC